MKTILVDSVNCIVSEEGMIFKEMQNLLDSYSNKKIILTGALYEKFQMYSLDKMPYEVFTQQHNPEKTDPKYFNALFEKFNLSKNDVVYFEHNMEAVKIAEAVGIKSYYYDENKKDLGSLKNFLDENLK